MNLSFGLLKQRLPGLNERRLTAEDFWSVVSRERCEVYEKRLRRNGYYVTNGVDNYIFLDHRLKELIWLEAAFHEMVHLLLHYPCQFLHDQQQTAARLLAIVAMIPQKDLPQMVAQYGQLESVMQWLVYQRLKILHDFKI